MVDEDACPEINRCLAYEGNYDRRGRPFPVIDRTVCASAREEIEKGGFCPVYDSIIPYHGESMRDKRIF